MRPRVAAVASEQNLRRSRRFHTASAATRQRVVATEARLSGTSLTRARHWSGGPLRLAPPVSARQCSSSRTIGGPSWPRPESPASRSTLPATTSSTTTRRDFPWSNTHHVEGDLTRAVRALKEATPRGLLVGSPQLSAALQRLDLVDEISLRDPPRGSGARPVPVS